MTELDQLLANAFASEGQSDDVNKVYAAMVRNYFFVPIEKMEANDIPLREATEDDEDPFRPLFAEHEGNIYMMAFDSYERFEHWAGEHIAEMGHVQILGRDLIRGIGEKVTLCINFGCEHYKEFNPEELLRLKTIVAKLDRMAGVASQH